ncbi:bola-like protein [Russula ochroleuca]|uniref:Bola-like protein n=1 Tax=Russula ochroleuca TaxID=152965 RepID=A0A9P5N3I6_9AGAM|nr:bola-like protein [Russula ochroleuca]
MFSTAIRRVTPSLRQQLRPRIATAAAAHTQAAASAAGAATVASAPSKLDEGEQAIYDKLSERFQPSELLVQDVSGGCGTFYAITIASKAFKGIPVVKQHRLVNEVLKKEIEGIHGLQVKTVPL